MIRWLLLALLVGLLGYLSIAYDRVYPTTEQPTEAFIEPACTIERVEHLGRVYAVRTIRTDIRKVCLLDPDLNPAGCIHLTCEETQ